MQNIRYAIWALVLVSAGVFGWLSFNKDKVERITFGADFSLVKSDGTSFNDEDMLGRPHLVFFGFTNCPDICPTTLYDTTSWIETLGEKAKKLDVYFITVDPERDTPKFLAEYLSLFDKNIVGLTGSVAEIDKAAKGYHVYYKKQPLDDGDYTMDHTASIFMMKSNGDFMGTIAYQENEETALKKLERLIKS
ncbi:MAG: SCO family protein [Nitratireductor sp.]